MNASQVKLLRDSYNVPAKNPDGSDALLAGYIRFITTDAAVDIVTSKDLVVVDDANELVHAVCVNEDMRAQATYPVKIITTSFLNINCIESVMTRENFKKFLDSGFFSKSAEWSDAKKEFMKKWIDGIKIQAQQPVRPTPYYTEEPQVISMPDKVMPRDDEISGYTEGASLAAKEKEEDTTD